MAESTERIDTAESIMNGFEIPDSLLKDIAGGVLDARTEEHLHEIVLYFKQQGGSKELALRLFSPSEDTQYAADCRAYIEQNWDLVSAD